MAMTCIQMCSIFTGWRPMSGGASWRRFRLEGDRGTMSGAASKVESVLSEQENGVDEDDEVNGDDRGYRSTAVFWIGWR